MSYGAVVVVGLVMETYDTAVVMALGWKTIPRFQKVRGPTAHGHINRTAVYFFSGEVVVSVPRCLRATFFLNSWRSLS